jgi:hypothetical protein
MLPKILFRKTRYNILAEETEMGIGLVYLNMTGFSEEK